MHLKHADLRKRGKGIRVVDADVLLYRFAVLARHGNAPDALWQADAGVLLEKAWGRASVRAAHQAQRTPGNVRQHGRRDSEQVLGKLLLGHAALGVDDLIRMSQAKTANVTGWPGFADGNDRRRRDRPGFLVRHLFCRRLSLRCGDLLHSARLCDRISSLANHVSRRLIFAQTLKSGMPHHCVAGPGSKLHLGDQLRAYPARTLAGFRGQRPGKGRLALLQRLQLCPQHACARLGEAGAGAPAIHQSIAVVDAQQQGSDASASIPRQGIAADDKLLPAHALQLQPVLAAAARVL